MYISYEVIKKKIPGLEINMINVGFGLDYEFHFLILSVSISVLNNGLPNFYF